VRVSDFLLVKDSLFARINLDNEEFSLYQQIYERLAVDTPTPDLVIYLQAPVEVLLERIARRGIEFEQLIEVDYLTRIADAYARFFHSYDASPLLIVNAADINPIENEADYQLLLAELKQAGRGRHYFNPGAKI
ncbi:MAG: deoxynucleoside kinase, partial [Gammaproteobacteria bacterium]|nr:deoxynucleoside kinase [Gammaproteobacteria bacterium]